MFRSYQYSLTQQLCHTTAISRTTRGLGGVSTAFWLKPLRGNTELRNRGLLRTPTHHRFTHMYIWMQVLTQCMSSCDTASFHDGAVSNNPHLNRSSFARCLYYMQLFRNAYSQNRAGRWLQYTGFTNLRDNSVCSQSRKRTKQDISQP